MVLMFLKPTRMDSWSVQCKSLRQLEQTLYNGLNIFASSLEVRVCWTRTFHLYTLLLSGNFTFLLTFMLLGQTKVGRAPAAFNIADDTGWNRLRSVTAWKIVVSKTGDVVVFNEINKKHPVNHYAVAIVDFCILNAFLFRLLFSQSVNSRFQLIIAEKVDWVLSELVPDFVRGTNQRL